MIHEVLRVGALQCNCSILGDEASREALVVDPGEDIDRILAVLARHRLTVQQILITHAHIDHIAGAQLLKQRTGAPILYNQHDLPLVRIMDEQAAWLGVDTPDVRPPDDDLPEARVTALRSSTASADAPTPADTAPIAAHVIHTPGHTPGSICLYLPGQHLLLAGDTLFAGSVGRTDLPGGDTQTLLRSIHTKLLSLPEATLVLPGHGPGTTIAKEKRTNPFLA